MRNLTTGLEIAACVLLIAGAYVLAGLGTALVAGSGVLFAASYSISRGGSA